MTIGLSTATGCIIPQEETFLDPLPARPNRPVRIIPERIEPTSNRLQTLNSSTCFLEFKIAVEDPDTDNRIQWFYYIDYDPTRSSNPVWANGEMQPGSTGQTVRPGIARALFQASTPLFAVGQHSVEVIVTDTTLDPERQPLPVSVSADGGTTNPGYSDSFTWFVDTKQGDCP